LTKLLFKNAKQEKNNYEDDLGFGGIIADSTKVPSKDQDGSEFTGNPMPILMSDNGDHDDSDGSLGPWLLESKFSPPGSESNPRLF